MNRVQWTAKAVKQMLKLPAPYREAVAQKARMLADFPLVEADIKKLAGRENTYRLRVGGYRLIFEWQTDCEPKIVEIRQVETRQSVYKS